MAGGRKKRKPRQYSADDQAQALAALAANGGNICHTAIQINVSETTLRRWRDRSQQLEHPPTQTQQTQQTQQNRDLSAALEAIAWMLLDAMPERITEAPLNQLISSLVAIDKMQLFQEKLLNSETNPINLSKMTNEQLEQLERLTTFLLSNSASSAFPEYSGTSHASDTDSTPAIAARVEPAIPASPLHAEEGDGSGT